MRRQYHVRAHHEAEEAEKEEEEAVGFNGVSVQLGRNPVLSSFHNAAHLVVL